MACASLLKSTLPVLALLLVLLAAVTLCLVSLRRRGATGGFLAPASSLLQEPPTRVADLVANVSRALAAVEARAGRLESALRQLGATAHRLVDKHEVRTQRDRFERRELCDNAWWWWRRVVLAGARQAARQAARQEAEAARGQQQQQAEAATDATVSPAPKPP